MRCVPFQDSYVIAIIYVEFKRKIMYNQSLVPDLCRGHKDWEEENLGINFWKKNLIY